MDQDVSSVSTGESAASTLAVRSKSDVEDSLYRKVSIEHTKYALRDENLQCVSQPVSPSVNISHPPYSRLINHVPLDGTDEYDRKWYAHFYYLQKAIQGKQEEEILDILKDISTQSAQTQIQIDIGLVYGIVTESNLSKNYLRYLMVVAESDGFKNCIICLQKIIELKFNKLLVTCRNQLLWLVREFVHCNVSGVDNLLIGLMRYITGGDSSRTTTWLAATVVKILHEHESWLLSSSTLIPFVFHTFARAVMDHAGATHTSLLKEEIELCTLLWNHRYSDVAQLGREVVRILNDGKEIPGIQALWLQLRNGNDVVSNQPRENANENRFSELMMVPTPAKYLAYRLTPKMEEQLLFMMERVQLGYITRYQRWFAMEFLSSAGSEAFVPDLIRYVCAVCRPLQNTANTKVTPRYHILGWLYLLCSKSPANLARAQFAIFFDCLYFRENENVMTIEPALLLMVKSIKSHPSLTLAMLQFLIFTVENFPSSVTSKEMMQKGVSTAFSVIIKQKIVTSLHSLQSFPLLGTAAPEIASKLCRIFPEHFTALDSSKAAKDEGEIHAVPLSTQSTDLAQYGTTVSGDSAAVKTSVSNESEVTEPSAHAQVFVRTTPEPIFLSTSLTRTPSPSTSDASNSPKQSTADSTSLSSSSFLPDHSEFQRDNSFGSLNLLSSHIQIRDGDLEVPPILMSLGEDAWKRLQECISISGTYTLSSFEFSMEQILTAWIKCDNAADQAQALGTYLHQIMEKMLLCSRIGVSIKSNSTRGSAFNVFLKQLLNQSPDRYLPVLEAMYNRDASISFRLLACCCMDVREVAIDKALAPYTTFVQHLDGEVAQFCIKDLLLTQHIDDARMIARSSVGISSSEAPDTFEMTAVDFAVLQIIPYFFSNADHPFLVKIMSRCESLIEFLVGHGTPSMLLSMTSWISLQKFSLFKHRMPNILLASLHWSSWEQFVLWDLILIELQAARSPSATKAFMAAARKVFMCADPDEHVETLMGLAKCLIHFTPDANILQCVFKLSDRYQEVTECILSCWMDQHAEIVKNYILVILQTMGNDPKTLSNDVSQIIIKLEALQKPRVKVNSGFQLLQDEMVVDALQRILSNENSKQNAISFPTLWRLIQSETMIESPSCPSEKKQKVTL